MDNSDLHQQFDASLRQAADTFRESLTKAKNGTLARNAAVGRLRSGATLRELAETFDNGLMGFCQQTFEFTHSWQEIEGIDEAELRKRASTFLRNLINDLPEPDYVSYGGSFRESVDEAIDKLIKQSKDRAMIKIRNFELGVGKPVTSTSPTYVVNAQTIIGGV